MSLSVQTLENVKDTFLRLQDLEITQMIDDLIRVIQDKFDLKNLNLDSRSLNPCVICPDRDNACSCVLKNSYNQRIREYTAKIERMLNIYQIVKQ